jgi:branched-chain amino acid aminotransferase
VYGVHVWEVTPLGAEIFIVLEDLSGADKEVPQMCVLKIRVERVQPSRAAELDPNNLPFGTVFSDHMLVAEFRDGSWGEPTIRPYGPLHLPPSISALQYGISVFEGLKAHQSPASDILLFRPWENARRLNRSAARLAMPEVPEPLFLDGLRELVRLDREWVPPTNAGALYIRPCLFSVEESIRVMPAEHYVFTIFTCPVGAYFTGPVDALITNQYLRAFPGGTGDVKPAGNYAAGFLAEREARTQGFNAVMWLDGREQRYVEECGVMNVFFVIDDCVLTPELSGTILAGVTRDSVITLLRDMGLDIRERRVSVDELVESHAQGRLRECFGTGTAATVSHIRRIRYQEHELTLPPVKERVVGPAVREHLLAVMTGQALDPHGWIEHI